MTVVVTNNTRQRIDQLIIKKSVEATLKYCRKKGDVSVVIIGDKRMRNLNHTYRGYDKITDVLSFPESNVSEDNFLGEIFIDYNVIKIQAKKFSPSVRFELAFIVIHGTLHLLGYEDATRKGSDLMEKVGSTIIKKII